MKTVGYHQVIAGLALLLMAASIMGSIGRVDRMTRMEPKATIIALNTASGPVTGTTGPAATRWSEPGDVGDWVFDLFTPPAIYLDPGTGQPLLKPRELESGTGPKPEAAIELVAIHVPAYPLQLVGHAGSGRTARGVFALTVTGETFLAAAGHHFTGPGLTLRTFEVSRPRGGLPATATAILVDELSGEEVVLTSLERKTLGPPLAAFRVIASGEQIECAEGGSFEADGFTCEVVKISTEPGEADVRFTAVGGSDAVFRTLRPVRGPH